MKRIVLLAALVATGLITTVATATAKAPNGNKITCFDGGGGPLGTCTPQKGNRFLLDTSTGGVAGVYLPAQIAGQLIGDVEHLSFHYDGTGAVAGSPRFSIPINTNGDGQTTDFFAFVDVVTCNNGSTTHGVLNVTKDMTCTINAGPEVFPNWDAFVAAHPTYRVANDNYTFVIQDTAGPKYTLSDVKIDKKPGH